MFDVVELGAEGEGALKGQATRGGGIEGTMVVNGDTGPAKDPWEGLLLLLLLSSLLHNPRRSMNGVRGGDEGGIQEARGGWG